MVTTNTHIRLARVPPEVARASRSAYSAQMKTARTGTTKGAGMTESKKQKGITMAEEKKAPTWAELGKQMDDIETHLRGELTEEEKKAKADQERAYGKRIDAAFGMEGEAGSLGGKDPVDAAFERGACMGLREDTLDEKLDRAFAPRDASMERFQNQGYGYEG